jgi:3-methyladenine DNA glycosylase AlkD
VIAAHDFYLQVQAVLEPLADRKRSEWMTAYMRGQFSYLGIPKPMRSKATQSLISGCKGLPVADLMKIAETLWQQKEREYLYTGAELLDRNSEAFGVGDLDGFFQLGLQKSWWDSIDTLASTINAIVFRERGSPLGQETMDRLLEHPDFWMRRIAMIHQLGWREQTDQERLFRYAQKLGGSREFFLQKAAGWALRDYARHEPREVIKFVAANRDSLSALTAREATKRCLPRNSSS